MRRTVDVALLALLLGSLAAAHAAPLSDQERKQLVLKTTLDCTDSTKRSVGGKLTNQQISDYCSCFGVRIGENISGDQVDAFNAGDQTIIKTVAIPLGNQCFAEMKKKFNIR